MRISYSTLRVLEACPYQYHLKQQEAPEKPDCRNFLVGAVCDNLLTDWYRFGCPPNWMEEQKKEYFERYIRRNRIIWRKLAPETLVREKVSDDKGLLYDRLGHAITKIETTLVLMSLNDSKNVVAQRQISLPMPKMEEHQLTGKLDLWDRNRRDLYEMKVSQDDARFDPDQLKFYALLIWLQDKQDVSNLYFFAPIRKQRIVPVSYQRADLRIVLERCADAIQLIEKGKFEPAGRVQQCYSCEFKMSVCPAWKNPAVIWREEAGKKFASFDSADVAKLKEDIKDEAV